MSPTPEMAAAATEFELLVTERQFEALSRWIVTRPAEPVEWQEAASFGDSPLYVTAAELAELRQDLQQLADRYLERVADPGLRPEGSRRVTFLQFAFPAVDE